MPSSETRPGTTWAVRRINPTFPGDPPPLELGTRAIRPKELAGSPGRRAGDTARVPSTSATSETSPKPPPFSWLYPFKTFIRDVPTVCPPCTIKEGVGLSWGRTDTQTTHSTPPRTNSLVIPPLQVKSSSKPPHWSRERFSPEPVYIAASCSLS
jgi:hypothetical protein